MHKPITLTKKLSIQLPSYHIQESLLSPKHLSDSSPHLSLQSEDDSEIAISKILNSCVKADLSEFSSAIDLITAKKQSQYKSEQIYKSLIKVRIIQSFKYDCFSKLAGIFKDCELINTGIPSEKRLANDNLVSIEQKTEEKAVFWKSQDFIDGNMKVIELIIHSYCLFSKSFTERQKVTNTMKNVGWTKWFIIAFNDANDKSALYGKKLNTLQKLIGDNQMPTILKFSLIKKAFKYDLTTQSFKQSDHNLKADTIIITNPY